MLSIDFIREHTKVDIISLLDSQKTLELTSLELRPTQHMGYPNMNAKLSTDDI